MFKKLADEIRLEIVTFLMRLVFWINPENTQEGNITLVYLSAWSRAMKLFYEDEMRRFKP